MVDNLIRCITKEFLFTITYSKLVLTHKWKVPFKTDMFVLQISNIFSIYCDLTQTPQTPNNPVTLQSLPTIN